MRAAGVFHEIKMSVSVIASTTGDSGDVEMSPRTTRTVAVACPSWLRATTIFTMISISDELNYYKLILYLYDFLKPYTTRLYLYKDQHQMAWPGLV